MRVQIRRPRRQFHGFHTNIGKYVQKLGREQRVTIMDQLALAMLDSVHIVGEIPTDLAHPQPIGDGGNARDLHLARRQLDEEQHHESLQPFSGPHFTVKKSAATISSQCRLRNSFQLVFRLRSGAGSMP